MLRLSYITATGLLLLGLSANLTAEEINLPVPEESTTQAPIGNPEFSVQLPGRAMSMETVQSRFGEALEKSTAVGEPPITKWIYPNFTVYFESEFVIHAVVNK
jgi:hypothetical protein